MRLKISSAILFLLLVHLNSFSQKKDTLFWFVGKWQGKIFKIDSSFMGGGTGGSVVIEPDGKIEIATPENKLWDQKIDDQVKQIDKEVEQVNSSIRKDESLYQFHMAEGIDKELNNVKHMFQSYKSEPSKTNDPVAKSKSAIAEACVKLKPRYMEIVDFAAAHRKDKHFDLPPAPVANYDCWMCDKDKRDTYDTLVAHYVKDFFQEDGAMIRDALGMLQQLALLGYTDQGSELNLTGGSHSSRGFDVSDLFHNDKNNPSKSGVCAYMDAYQLSDAIMIIAQRSVRKAEQLFNDNRKNYYALEPVIEIYLGAIRNVNMLGMPISDNSALAEIGESVRALYQKMRDKLLIEKDYSQIGNIPLILGLDRQVAMLGGSSADQWQELLNFCHFKLTYEVDIKEGANGGYIIAHYKAQAKVVAELDSIKCVTFQLDKSEEANIHATLITNEMTAPGPHPVYAGTMKGKSPLPIFNFHFCRSGVDTLKLNYLQPDGVAIWNVPQSRPLNAFMLVSENVFKNPGEAEAEAIEIKDNASGLKNSIMVDEAEVKKKIAELQKKGLPPMQMAAEIKKIMEMQQSNTVQTINAAGMLMLPVTVQNKSSVLVKQTFDAKQMNPLISKGLVYGYIHITFEHDPKE